MSVAALQNGPACPANPEGAAEVYGKSYPLGATIVPGGANFSVFSREATGIELLLFEREDDFRPAEVIRLDPAVNRTYHYWHAFVPGLILLPCFPSTMQVCSRY